MSERKHHTAILVNLEANAGRAEKSWHKIRDKVVESLEGTFTIVSYTPSENITSIIDDLVNDLHARFIVSAGGDGSLHYIINHLMTYPKSLRNEIVVGCIGLGSSNDSLKPLGKKIFGIPLRIEPHNSLPVDLGTVVIDDDESARKYFLNNASLGVTANANHLFNQPDLFIRMTKKSLTNVAIIYAALKTILFHRNIPAKLEYNEDALDTKLSSISIIKTPYLAGLLKYDQAILRDDGKLGVNICDDMNKIQLINTVFGLMRSKFSGRPGCVSAFCNDIKIKCDSTVPIEIDGEILHGKEFTFSVFPKAINFINQ